MGNHDFGQPVVSVIIPVYNRAGFLKEALESAKNQSFKNMEIIVVDDGSTDETVEFLRKDRGIRVVRQERGGNASARNRGLKEARGRYIGFLDSDDKWLPEKTAAQVRFLEDHPDFAFVYSGTCLIDEHGQVIGERRLQPNEKTTYECLFEKNRIISFSVTLIRRSCLDAAGWLDEHLPQSTDYDLWLRLARRYPFAYLDGIFTHYRVHDENISGNLEGRIKAHLHTLSKPELTAGMSWKSLRLRKASAYFQVANQYFTNGLYRKGAACYARAVLYHPAVGVYQWKYLYRKQPYANWKRFIRVYYRIATGIIKPNEKDIKIFQKGKKALVARYNTSKT